MSNLIMQSLFFNSKTEFDPTVKTIHIDHWGIDCHVGHALGQRRVVYLFIKGARNSTQQGLIGLLLVHT